MQQFAMEGHVLREKYAFEKIIGKGGSAEVYLVNDVVLQRPWAVKVLHKTADPIRVQKLYRAYQTEREILKSLDHPALPRLVDAFEDRNGFYLVMDYVEGMSLRKLIRAGNAVPREQVIAWGLELCAVLTYLHGQDPPLIYRDMKPENVIMTISGHLKLIDFGIAGGEHFAGESEVSGFGTRGYAPPEQYVGNADVRSDIYSLGMTLCFLLTGEDPKKGEHPSIDMDGLGRILTKCTERSPQRRYQSCEELKRDLEHLQRKHASVPVPFAGRLRKRKQSENILLLLGTVTAVLVLLSAWVVHWQMSREDRYGLLVSEQTERLPDAGEREACYLEAIELEPANPAAYQKLLQEYVADGCLTDGENLAFAGKILLNQVYFDSSPEVENLFYEAGVCYLSYYGREDAIWESLLKAKDYFARFSILTQQEGDTPRRQQAASLVSVAEYVEQYGVEEETLRPLAGETCEEVLNALPDSLELIVGTDSTLSPLQKMQALEQVLTFLENQHEAWYGAGIKEAQVYALVEQLQQMASDQSADTGTEAEYREALLERCEQSLHDVALIYSE